MFSTRRLVAWSKLAGQSLSWLKLKSYKKSIESLPNPFVLNCKIHVCIYVCIYIYAFYVILKLECCQLLFHHPGKILRILHSQNYGHCPLMSWDTRGHVISAGIILCMHSANERWRYIVTSSPIGWVHTKNVPCISRHDTEPEWGWDSTEQVKLLWN